MTKTRVNVYAGKKWADPVLWYARGVAAMQARPIDDPTSWRYWAAMHGFDQSLWEALGHLTAHEAQPSKAAVKQFWKQCQHGSWYFLPWHRGYLLAFEKMVRAAVVDAGGPVSWTLPYWNPFGTGESKLPPAFRRNSWPDDGDNPLFVAQRYGPNSDGDVFVPPDQVDLDALQRRHFTGVSTGGSPGFGGVDTGFSHGGPVHGELERMPHDQIHGLVGGGDPHHPTLPGLMSDPDTAALDPIFWLHHANIDRLWEVWNQSGDSHHNPSDPQWKSGPASVGDRAFEMPDPDGSTWTYTPQDMKSVTALGYQYDDLTPTGTEQAAQQADQPAAAEGVAPVPSDAEPELVGATTEPVALEGAGASGVVQLDPAVRRNLTAALTASPPTAAPDDGSERVFLNLENVRGNVDATVFEVYVGLGPDDSPADHPELRAGSVAPFGVRKATQPDGDHQGQGLTFVLDITEVVNRLHLDSSFDVDRLPVRLVPLRPVRAGAGITVGRISIYRQAV